MIISPYGHRVIVSASVIVQNLEKQVVVMEKKI